MSEVTYVLDQLSDQVKRKLEAKEKEPFFSGKRYEGYEQAMLSVLSMIHSMKERYNK